MPCGDARRTTWRCDFHPPVASSVLVRRPRSSVMTRNASWMVAAATTGVLVTIAAAAASYFYFYLHQASGSRKQKLRVRRRKPRPGVESAKPPPASVEKPSEEQELVFNQLLDEMQQEFFQTVEECTDPREQNTAPAASGPRHTTDVFSLTMLSEESPSDRAFGSRNSSFRRAGHYQPPPHRLQL